MPQTRCDPVPLTVDDWTALIDPFNNTDHVVLQLDALVPLAKPVPNDTNGGHGT